MLGRGVLTNLLDEQRVLGDPLHWLEQEATERHPARSHGVTLSQPLVHLHGRTV